MNSVKCTSEDFKEWLENLNSEFGDVVKHDAGVFEANLSRIPPLVDTALPKDLNNCFVFKEIKTKPYTALRDCEIMLKSRIIVYISEFKDLDKCTLVWRVEPFIEYTSYSSYYEGVTPCYMGYTRLKVINKDSKRGSYYE